MNLSVYCSIKTIYSGVKPALAAGRGEPGLTAAREAPELTAGPEGPVLNE